MNQFPGQHPDKRMIIHAENVTNYATNNNKLPLDIAIKTVTIPDFGQNARPF